MERVKIMKYAGKLSEYKIHKPRTSDKINGLVHVTSGKMRLLWDMVPGAPSDVPSSPGVETMRLKEGGKIYREHFKPRFALVDALVRRLGKPFESVLKYESALETMTAGSFSTFVLFLEIAPESRGEAGRFFLENGFSEVRENTFEKEDEIIVAEYSQVSRSGLVVEMEGMRALLPPPERVAAELVRECHVRGFEECGMWAMALFHGFAKMGRPLDAEAVLEFMPGTNDASFREKMYGVVGKYAGLDGIPFRPEREGV